MRGDFILDTPDQCQGCGGEYDAEWTLPSWHDEEAAKAGYQVWWHHECGIETRWGVRPVDYEELATQEFCGYCGEPLRNEDEVKDHMKVEHPNTYYARVIQAKERGKGAR